ncbi:MAG: substrate-binding domain-containing protein [Gemmataceae bacterium]
MPQSRVEPAPDSPKKRVVFHFPLRAGPWSEIVRGAYRYADRHTPWLITLLTDERFDAARGWKPDGVIAMVRTAEVAKKLAAWGGPVVDTACDLDDLPFARVRLDPEAIGGLAAEHLSRLPCRTFAFVGDVKTPAGRRSRDGFFQRLRKAGHAGLTAPDAIGNEPYRVVRGAARIAAEWIRNLPVPVAIFCAHDALALRMSEACQLAERRVPEDVAILGTLNDEFLCTAAQPAISSIECPLAMVGYEAARVLDAWMSGRRPPRQPVELPPVGVVARLSTDATVVADPGVRAALQFIRNHYAERIGVERIVASSGLSRSTLERRFKDLLGHGPLGELLLHRLGQARHLLVQTELPVKKIARSAGFHDTRHLSSMFRQKLGISPSEFRRHNRPS